MRFRFGSCRWRVVETAAKAIIGLLLVVTLVSATLGMSVERTLAQEANLDSTPGFVLFDDRYFDQSLGYTGTHGFQVYNVLASPLRNVSLPWTVTVAGSNGPRTFNGFLDSNGRGAFTYTGSNVGVDTLDVVVGSAAGSAVRTYGIEENTGDTDQIPAAAVWDEIYFDDAVGYSGFHGFTVLNVAANHLRVPLEWTVTVRGANPGTYSGTLDANGRGGFSYTGSNSGVDVMTLTVGSVIAHAARSYGLQDPETPAVAPESPKTSLQVWTFNIYQMRYNWKGFVRRANTNAFAPDIILVQEMWESQADTFGRRLNRQLGITYDYRYSADGTTGTYDATAIFWNARRFSLSNVDRWNSAGSCPETYRQVGVGLVDHRSGKNVAAASLHVPQADGSEACISGTLLTANQKMDDQFARRDVTLIGGDLNRRPDKRGELPTNGTETDPNCWYRGFSAAHDNISVLTGGSCSSVSDRYYDAVWLDPSGGGAANPASGGICGQFTRKFFHLDAPDASDASSSCTDLFRNGPSGAPGPDSRLDKARIDYLWVGWETTAGTAWRPPPAQAAALVENASADLGLDLTSLNAYSDHRAVQALLTYPVFVSEP